MHGLPPPWSTRDRLPPRLPGEVLISLPLSWQAVGYLVCAILIGAALFLVTATYSRVETVNGSIVLDKREAQIVPTRSGVVASVAVEDGQSIRKGQTLVAIRSEERMLGGVAGPDETIEALARADSELASQAALGLEAAAEERRRLDDRSRGLRLEIASIAAQERAQIRLVELAEGEFARAEAVAERGFISRRDINQREGMLIERRQQMAHLAQLRFSKEADLQQVERARAEADVKARSQAAGIQSSRAQLRERAIGAETAKGYVLAAPVAGVVTATTARVGQPAVEGAPLMLIIPQGSTMRAELLVPTQAAGFLEVGQEVKLAVNAFPYQRFGVLPGRISRISGVPVPRQTDDGRTSSVYLVQVDLERTWIYAFGRRQPLSPGMELTARMIIQRQTLFEHLFEPLYAVLRR